jgi:hypothetical protein
MERATPRVGASARGAIDWPILNTRFQFGYIAVHLDAAKNRWADDLLRGGAWEFLGNQPAPYLIH